LGTSCRPIRDLFLSIFLPSPSCGLVPHNVLYDASVKIAVKRQLTDYERLVKRELSPAISGKLTPRGSQPGFSLSASRTIHGLIAARWQCGNTLLPNCRNGSDGPPNKRQVPRRRTSNIVENRQKAPNSAGRTDSIALSYDALWSD
jgi:hypothetical protein